MALQRIPAGVLILLSLVSAFSAQDQSAVVPRLKLDVDLVLVNATVTDSDRRNLVPGLNREDFQIWEDKIEQKIEYVSSEAVPVSVGVILDFSASMKDKAADARSAAAMFLKSGTAEDEYFQVQFSNHPQVTSEFTSDISQLQSRLLVTQAKGSTALYDAIYLGLNKLKESRYSRKALLVISDGEDNRSRYSFVNVRDFLREQDIQLYAIGMLDRETGIVGHNALVRLSELTGGRAFFPLDAEELPSICRRIAAELKNEYVIGYKSTNRVKDGSWRKIKVNVTAPEGTKRPSLDVSAKTGYFAPGSDAGLSRKK